MHRFTNIHAEEENRDMRCFPFCWLPSFSLSPPAIIPCDTCHPMFGQVCSFPRPLRISMATKVCRYGNELGYHADKGRPHWLLLPCDVLTKPAEKNFHVPSCNHRHTHTHTAKMYMYVQHVAHTCNNFLVCPKNIYFHTIQEGISVAPKHWCKEIVLVVLPNSFGTKKGTRVCRTSDSLTNHQTTQRGHALINKALTTNKHTTLPFLCWERHKHKQTSQQSKPNTRAVTSLPNQSAAPLS